MGVFENIIEALGLEYDEKNMLKKIWGEFFKNHDGKFGVKYDKTDIIRIWRRRKMMDILA